jgi:hypothetical protein
MEMVVVVPPWAHLGQPCPFYLRPFFWNQRRKYGEVLKAALLWARVPKLFAAVAVLFGVIDRHSSPIDPALRSLVIACHRSTRVPFVVATSLLLKCPSSDVPIPVDMAMEDGMSLT